MTKQKRLSPGKLIAVGFLTVILVGSILLYLPAAHSGEVVVTYLDALFTSVSAVCVTGLVTLETGIAYSAFGQVVIILLIQIGGLGITTLGAGLIALLGGRLNQRENTLVKEALNYPTWNGIKPLIRAVLILDISIELLGAVLYFISFIREYPLGRAVWMSVFHSISAFNNAGFDILGRGNSIGDYTYDVYFNLVTCLMIILGGLGFFVIRELLLHRRGERFSLHTKIVLAMTSTLLVGGTLILKLIEGSSITWLGAFFSSVTARTAGFATFPYSGFSNAGIIVMCVLMFIGASPGSTGGGMKTTTLFALIKSLISHSTGRESRAFGRRVPADIMQRAFVIISLGFSWTLIVTCAISAFEPTLPLRDVMFECFSAIGTVGLTTGITPLLTVPSRIVIMLTMYIGRLGPLTVATLWARSKASGVSVPEEQFPIG
ncbi:MAG: H(+)-transporting ATPase [Ruminococcaceae bacterium]|nr:H(+)-transporting ATPase [Oscillospiraceae bacterium]